MILLAIIAPVAAVVFLRLGLNQCSVIDPFGLPWEVVPLTLVRTVCVAIVVASSVFIVVGFTRRELRVFAAASVAISVVAVVPGVIALFLLMFGDVDVTRC